MEHLQGLDQAWTEEDSNDDDFVADSDSEVFMCVLVRIIHVYLHCVCLDRARTSSLSLSRFQRLSQLLLNHNAPMTGEEDQFPTTRQILGLSLSLLPPPSLLHGCIRVSMTTS